MCEINFLSLSMFENVSILPSYLINNLAVGSPSALRSR